MTFDRWLSWLAGDRISDLTAIHFAFNIPLGITLCLIFLLGTGIAVFLYEWPKLRGLSGTMRFILTGFRTAILLITVFLFLDPCLVGDLLKPGDQYIALLFDNSQSMQVYNGGGKTRGERLKDTYQQERANFEERLQKKYRIVQYQFGDTIESLDQVQQLDYSRNTSDLIQAIQSAGNELDGLNVPAIVLFSDGVQQTDSAKTNLSQQVFPGIPVFTVGTGDRGPWRDIRIQRLSVNRTNFDKSPVNVSAGVEIQGYKGQQIQAAILKNNKIVQSQTLTISQEMQNNQLHFEFTPPEKDWLEYTLRIRPFSQAEENSAMTKDSRNEEERTPQNNNRSFVVDNTQKEYKILYYCSHPNWEHRFVRRALQEDSELMLSSLVLLSRAQKEFVFRGARTTLTNPLFEGFDNDEEKYGRYDESVYLRLGLGETELVKGFPSQKEDLFSFDLLIVGDVEWDDFSGPQLQLIRDFVDRRGGSLLLLGGRDKFVSETFLRSPIVTMLPVLPGDPSNPDEVYISDFIRIKPTASGEIAGTWSLNANPSENQNEWDRMPNLYGFNPFDVTRPGSTIYSFAQRINGQSKQQPFFISQRYGNGKCAIITTGETWPWRMYKKEDSNAYERLWRQWIRGLVADVPGPIQFLHAQDSSTIGEPATLKFRIRNNVFEEQEGARVLFSIQPPSQKEIQPGLEESLEDAGVYTCEWTPSETGKHMLNVQLTNDDGESEDSLRYAVHVTRDLKEFENPQHNPDFLREIAQTTGGRFFSLDELSMIPGALPYESSQENIQRKIHLWHNPFFYFIVLVLVSLEWYLRRKHGHP